MSNTSASVETYDEKVDRISSDLIGVLRDALGPENRLPAPLADYCLRGYRSVTVRDGEGGRTELTARLTASGEVREYSARILMEDPLSRPWAAVGPVRMEFSSAPEESPSIIHVLPLIVRLEQGAERMGQALKALQEAGLPADTWGPAIALREPCPRGMRTVATVELDQDNGTLRVHGRDARQVRKILESAGIF